MNVKRHSGIHKAVSTASKVLEALFLLLTSIYLLYQMLGPTTFYLPYPWWFDKALLRTMAGITVLRLLILGPRRWEAWASVAMAALYYMIFRSTGYRFVVYLGVLTAGLSGIDYRRILKTYLMTVSVFFFVTILAALSGAITNFVYTKYGTGIRSSWGFCYPTDFASMVLFILLTLWVSWRKLPDWAMLVFCVASILLTRNIAHSNTSYFCTCLFALLILFHSFEIHVVARHRKLGWLKSGSDWLMTLAFPICAVVMFALMLVYHRSLSVGAWANNLLSDRLRLSVDAWQKHGVKAFGTPFDQIGFGFSTVGSPYYNFVDSTYPLILLRYGWVTLLVLGFTWGWTIRRAIRCGDKRLALVMGLIAVHCFSEQHFTEINYNILLVMPFAMYNKQMRDEKRSPELSRSALVRQRAAVLVACTLFAAGLYFGASRLLPWLKTVLQAKNLCGGGINGWRVIIINLCVLGIISAVFWGLYRLLKALFNREPIRRYTAAVVVLAVCVGLSGTAIAYGESIVAHAKVSNQEMLNADRPALEIVEATATKPVYSDILPELYHREFNAFAKPMLSGEELARYRDSTLLMDADTEKQVLIRCGFLYSRISNTHAIYTTDSAVEQALKDGGYSVTGFYDEVKEVDLAAEAQINSLEYDASRGLILDGPLQSLSMGPYVALYDGTYAATYDLRLPEGAVRDGRVVCHLRVTSAWGENTLAEQEIRDDQFDESGALSVPVPFNVQNGQGVEFLVSDEDAAPVNVERICYARTASYDVHTTCDDKLRTIREAYYSMENAEPATLSDGCSAYEYSYDRANNVVETRNFDINNRLVLNASGYATVRRAYNYAKQVIRVAYYGIDDKLIALPSGQAVEEMDYDKYGNLTRCRFYDAQEAPVGIGQSQYASFANEYDQEGNLSLTYFYDVKGCLLPCGSSGFHDYLQKLRGKSFVISVNDDASQFLTATLIEDMQGLGIQTDLRDKFRHSYYAVVADGDVVEDCSEEQLSWQGQIMGKAISVVSAGYNSGPNSSISIDGVEYSENRRGMNIVVLENGAVTDTVTFDTSSFEMTRE